MKKIALSRLHKLEVPQFVNEVMETLEKYDLKTMHLQEMYNALCDLEPKIKLLEVDFGPHPLTKDLDELHEKRLTYAAIITTQMRTLDKVHSKETKSLVRIAKPVVRVYLNYLRKKNKKVVHECIEGFLLHVEDDLQVKNALHKLGFSPYIDELQKINSCYLEIHFKKGEDISKRFKGSTGPIQKEIQHTLRLLFDQIDLYQYIHKDVDYDTLIVELNYTITSYSKIIKTRATANKKRANTAKLKHDEEQQALIVEGEKIIKESNKGRPTKKKKENKSLEDLLRILKRTDKDNKKGDKT